MGELNAAHKGVPLKGHFLAGNDAGDGDGPKDGNIGLPVTFGYFHPIAVEVDQLVFVE